MSEALEALGWNEHWAQAFSACSCAQDPAIIAGRVAREGRAGYRVLAAEGAFQARISGRLRHDAQERNAIPAVGDWVALRRGGGSQTTSRPVGHGRRVTHVAHASAALIEEILPRRSSFSRKAVRAGGSHLGPGRTEEQVLAANIDTVFLVSGLNEEFRTRRIERYLAIAWDSGARPVIVLNKSDLCDDLAARVAEVTPSAVNVPIHAMSAVSGDGISALDAYLALGQTVVFLGSSGVGKSSLINRLMGEERQETQPLRASGGRGRHVTTSREMFLLPRGAVLIDTPGLREIQAWEDDTGLSQVFEDIETLAASCRFRDCRHDTEPGCAVKQAVAEGRLDAGRLVSYLKLQQEAAVLAVRKSQRARMVYDPGGKRVRGGRDRLGPPTEK